MADDFSERKARASGWFREVRDTIVAAFEALEDSQSQRDSPTGGLQAGQPAGRFEASQTARASDDGSDAGGGLMAVMRGGCI